MMLVVVSDGFCVLLASTRSLQAVSSAALVIEGSVFVLGVLVSAPIHE